MSSDSYWVGREQAQEEYERKWLVKMAVKWDCNITEMAEHGGVDRTTIYRIMKRVGLTKEDLLRLISPGSFK